MKFMATQHLKSRKSIESILREIKPKLIREIHTSDVTNTILLILSDGTDVRIHSESDITFEYTIHESSEPDNPNNQITQKEDIHQ